MRLALHIEAKPTPRPRFVTRGKFVSTYYPKDYVAYTDALRHMLEDQLAGKPPYTTAVCVDITVTLERPKTTKLPFPKPDVDNFAKGLLDAMTKAAVWTDDTLVYELRVRKRWGAVDSVEIEVVDAGDLLA